MDNQVQTSTFIINKYFIDFTLWLCLQGGFRHPPRGEGGRFLHVLQPGFAAEGGHRRTSRQIRQTPPSALGPHRGEWGAQMHHLFVQRSMILKTCKESRRGG